MKAENLVGRVFGRLTVLEFAAKDGKRNTTWHCLCKCGNRVVVRAYSLRSTKRPVKSCGCLQIEAATRICHARTKHGQTVGGKISPEYSSYQSAIQRCSDPNFIGWSSYGGRKIAFRFKSFEEFYNTLGPRPTEHHTLDRINNDGHYEPGNVRWATKKEQANNRRLPNKPRRSSTSGFLGVAFDKSRNKYQATLTIKGKQTNLGRFSTPEQAHRAYANARAEAGIPLS